ncbi:hypothetical protein RclHR1_04250001 [Rhizophagus clarus]|uniref:Uncharacterized protein n=1 Tax=Rhizophagus clarus TaxID=94130 RepID=A0A2Z6RTJ0_9GLOM|nr:hypothetical protein RclHR1_04250001 [Rhizophagus clarus]
MWQDCKKRYTIIYIIRIIFYQLLKNKKDNKETLNNSDQKTDENKIYKNELKNSNSAKIDKNSNFNNSTLILDNDNCPPPAMSKYDPNLDYEKLLCDLFDEEDKNCAVLIIY